MKVRRLQNHYQVLGLNQNKGVTVKIFSNEKIFIMRSVLNCQNDWYLAASIVDVKDTFMATNRKKWPYSFTNMEKMWVLMPVARSWGTIFSHDTKPTLQRAITCEARIVLPTSLPGENRKFVKWTFLFSYQQTSHLVPASTRSHEIIAFLKRPAIWPLRSTINTTYH